MMEAGNNYKNLSHEAIDFFASSKHDFYVIDTSALMNNPNGVKELAGFFSKEMKNKKIIILSSVIDELDNLSKRDERKGYLARKARDVIDDIRNLDSVMYLDCDGYSRSLMKMDKYFNQIKQDKAKSKTKNIRSISWSGKRFIKNGNKDVDEYIKYLAINYDVVAVTNDNRIFMQIDQVTNDKKSFYFDGFKKDIYSGIEKIKSDKLFDKIEDYNTSDRKKCIEDEIGKEMYPNEFFLISNGENEKKLFVNDDNKMNKISLETMSNYFGSKLKLRNMEQAAAVKLLTNPEINLVFLYGPAGTGKTFLSLLSGLYQWNVTNIPKKDEGYDNLVTIVGIVPIGNDIGYLPGNKDSKLKPWAGKFYDNFRVIRKINNKSKRIKNFDQKIRSMNNEPTTYLRGRSINDSFIILEEAQNLEPLIMKTTLTRVGDGSKIVIIGDTTQIDNRYLNKNFNGITISISKLMGKSPEEYPKYMGVLELTENVRSKVSKLAASRM